MERSKSTILIKPLAQHNYQPRRRGTGHPSTSSVGPIRESQGATSSLRPNLAPEHALVDELGTGGELFFGGSRGAEGGDRGEQDVSSASENHVAHSPTTTATVTTDGGVTPPSPRPSDMSASRQRFLRASCGTFLPGRIKFAGEWDPSPMLALCVCNRSTRSSIEGPLYRWHGSLYLLMKSADVYPSRAETFIDLRWNYLTPEEPASPILFEATYRGTMANPDNIQTPQRWHKGVWGSKYLWGLDFELGIPLEHWHHPGRGECSLIASVSMGPEAKLTHASFSGGDRVEGWSPQLQHKLPLVHIAV
ncbi:hypothetical protein FIBSPDRAFT_969482 [Athelia psychrophila]|uniref:Uncharacterized protein n=1 Tax=Athelia psychrophila TaxID=1759441 RepID=A0A167TGQ1_9AGAM|nr:hypothetical protein FIBSPDRAFT_969482 [Fibularhizoctonia sp. CBS 109695]